VHVLLQLLLAGLLPAGARARGRYRRDVHRLRSPESKHEAFFDCLLLQLYNMFMTITDLIMYMYEQSMKILRPLTR
jgi:hypothetical protein